jgi:spindle assembly abnormal protein 6
VTDERDAFFLFFINVSEDEFPELKREQSLRVDFENFAQHFVELLTRVMESAPASPAEAVEGEAIAAAAVGQAFHAVLRTASADDASSTDAFFEVVQANEFKNLMHLSLRMSAADDVATARNLAERLALQRERNVDQRNELQQRTAALAVLQEEKTQAVEELEVLQRQQGDSQRALRLDHAEEINRIRRAADEEREAVRAEVRAEVRALNEANEAKLETFRALHGELQERHDEHASTSARVQTDLHQHAARAASVGAELARLRAENEVLRREGERTQSELHKKTKALNAVQIKQSALAQKVVDAEEMADRITAYEAGLKEQLVAAKESIHLHREASKQREMENDAAIHEINKGNEIIDRLRARLSKLKGEAKLRNNIVAQQEKRLDQEARALALEQRRVRHPARWRRSSKLQAASPLLRRAWRRAWRRAAARASAHASTRRVSRPPLRPPSRALLSLVSLAPTLRRTVRQAAERG